MKDKFFVFKRIARSLLCFRYVLYSTQQATATTSKRNCFEKTKKTFSGQTFQFFREKQNIQKSIFAFPKVLLL